MSDQPRGLYELLITEALHGRLAGLDDRWEAAREPLRAADAPDRIALHLGRVIQRALAAVTDEERVAVATTLARRLVDEIGSTIRDVTADEDAPVAPAAVLHAILARLPDGRSETIPEPLIPLLDTTVLTNAPGEPRVGSQLVAEIASADRLDVVMAFIRRSGMRPFLEALRRHSDAGRPLRILTTSYTGSTEGAALDALRALGAEVRVSYDTTATRLHAKAWLFHRASGFSTAYIGSSNWTHAAQAAGLEWNVRISEARNPDVVTKMAAVFESYWHGGDFVPYDPDEFASRAEQPARNGPSIALPPTELRPDPFQERLLEEIAVSRRLGHHRNLLVSATGTGKTVMAAIDYQRLRSELPRARLLFVAHRVEILEQSRGTFQHALRDVTFGELWVGGQQPSRFEHIFASIQSLSATGPHHLDPTHFDVVVVDEFHHAAADTYRALLERVRPVELLGLTATPERSDGLPLLHWFDDRIAAELRLWDAIDQHRLCPFSYYGVHDGLDLRDIPWRRGRGYDIDGLSRLLTGNDVWARRVIAQVIDHVDDPRHMQALGFCVSVDHARFMARAFGDAGISAAAVWGDTPPDERREALRRLADGAINVVFSVDLFNEGIDLPTVDTLLLLRPTDSPVLFLQQLGRGLRMSRGKVGCTVLDFVGRHRSEFRFDRRFRALLGGSRSQLVQQIAGGFPFLPAGCHMELDPVAADIVLSGIRNAVPSRWTAKVEELRAMTAGGRPVRLTEFLGEAGLEIEDVYAGNRSWSDLLEAAGVSTRPPGPHETGLRRACGRILHVDDDERLMTYRRVLEADGPPDLAAMTTRDQRLLHMLVASVAGHVVDKSASIAEACAVLWAHPQVRLELLELLDALSGRVDHLHAPLAHPADVPLQIHGRYSRLEILAAFGRGSGARVPPWQTGVYWLKEQGVDLLAFTLDKTSGQFSPTTRYRDYAISRDLIHWESQSTTRADSETGLRYRQHREVGSAIMLFARLRTDDRAFWFLGPAHYVRHEGELPMAITWRLEHPLPGDLFASFAAAVA